MMILNQFAFYDVVYNWTEIRFWITGDYNKSCHLSHSDHLRLKNMSIMMKSISFYTSYVLILLFFLSFYVVEARERCTEKGDCLKCGSGVELVSILQLYVCAFV